MCIIYHEMDPEKGSEIGREEEAIKGVKWAGPRCGHPELNPPEGPESVQNPPQSCPQRRGAWGIGPPALVWHWLSVAPGGSTF